MFLCLPPCFDNIFKNKDQNIAILGCMWSRTAAEMVDASTFSVSLLFLQKTILLSRSFGHHHFLSEKKRLRY